MVLHSIGFCVRLLLPLFLAATVFTRSLADGSASPNILSGDDLSELLADNEVLDSRLQSGESPIHSQVDLSSDEDLVQDAPDSNIHMPYVLVLGKRDASRAYEFGLGKRSNQYAFGLGKRNPKKNKLGKKDDPIYAFGLGKRNEYAFGLGKRMKYINGLGKKRDPYAFGLGK